MGNISLTHTGTVLVITRQNTYTHTHMHARTHAHTHTPPHHNKHHEAEGEDICLGKTTVVLQPGYSRNTFSEERVIALGLLTAHVRNSNVLRRYCAPHNVSEPPCSSIEAVQPVATHKNHLS